MTLFPEIPDPPPSPDKGPSVAKRRTEYRAALMRQGLHPLATLIPHLRLHPQAPPPDDRKAPGPRCGTCARSGHQSQTAGSYIKCDLYPSRSDASDIRLWWPACTSYLEAHR